MRLLSGCTVQCCSMPLIRLTETLPNCFTAARDSQNFGTPKRMTLHALVTDRERSVTVAFQEGSLHSS